MKLNRGVVELLRETVICEEGDELSPEQARLLKHFEHKMAEFRVDMVAHWSDSEFTNFDAADDEEE